ncbi:MAG: hypothetical protein ACREE7_19525, partial [Dongiaceae bacterium]
VQGLFDVRTETPFGDLAGKLRATAAGDSTIAGQLAVTESRFDIGNAGAAATGEIRFALPADRRPRIDAILQLANLAAAGGSFPAGSLVLKLDESRASGTLQLSGAGDAVALDAALAVADPYGTAPALEASIDATLTHEAWLWSVVGLPQPTTGTLQLEASLAAPFPTASVDLSPGRIVPTLRALVAVAGYSGGVDLVASGLDWPGVATGIDGRVGVDIDTIDGTVALVMPRETRLRADPAAELLARLGLPAALLEPLAGPLDIATRTPVRLRLYPSAEGATLSAGGEFDLANAAGAGVAARIDASAEIDDSLGFHSLAFGRSEIVIRDLPFDRIVLDRVTWHGKLDRTADGGGGALHVEVSAPSLPIGTGAARGVTLALDTDVAIAANDVVLRLSGAENALSVELLTMPQLANTLKDLRLPLRGGDAPLLEATLADGRATALAWDLQIGRVAAKPAFLVGGPEPMVAAATLDGVALIGSWTPADGARGAVELAQSTVTLAGWQLAARKITGRASFDGSQPVDVSLNVGELASTAKPGFHLTLGVNATGSIVDDRLTFRARAGDARKRLTIVADGEYRLDAGSGRAQVRLEPIAFVPGGLQPRQLIPALSPRIESVSGTVGLGGTVSWKGARVASDLKLALKDVSIAMPEAELLRINAVLAVDSLLPLTTAPDQQVAIGAINVGVPLTDGLAT